MPGKRQPWLHWVNKDDAEQCKWVIRELRRHGEDVVMLDDRKPASDLFYRVGQWPDRKAVAHQNSGRVKELDEICAKVKRKWEREERQGTGSQRKRSLQVPISQDLSRRLKRECRQLGLRQDALVVSILTEEFTYRQKLESQIRDKYQAQIISLKNEVEDLKERLRIELSQPKQRLFKGERDQFIALKRAERHGKGTIKALKMELEATQKVAQGWLTDSCKWRAMLESAGLDQQMPDKWQIMRAGELFRQGMAVLSTPVWMGIPPEAAAGKPPEGSQHGMTAESVRHEPASDLPKESVEFSLEAVTVGVLGQNNLQDSPVVVKEEDVGDTGYRGC